MYVDAKENSEARDVFHVFRWKPKWKHGKAHTATVHWMNESYGSRRGRRRRAKLDIVLEAVGVARKDEWSVARNERIASANWTGCISCLSHRFDRLV